MEVPLPPPPDTQQAVSPIDPKTGLLRPELVKLMQERADADPDLKRLKDTARMMQAAPLVAGLTEMSQLQGGGALNLNPALAWASGLPGAPSNLGAIAKANPHQTPTEILKGLMGMGNVASDAQARYLKERDKFMGRQMGGGGGGLSVSDRAYLENVKAGGRGGLQEDKFAFESSEADKNRELKKTLADIENNLNLSKAEKAEAVRLEKEKYDRDIRSSGELRKYNSDSATTALTMAKKQLRSMHNIFKRYRGKDDFPGIGVADVPPSIPGSELIQSFKDMATKPSQYSKDAKQIRQYTLDMANIHNKLMNSARATNQDFARAVSGKGLGLAQDEEQALRTFQQMLDGAKSQLRKDLSSFSKDARAKYDSDPDNLQLSDFAGMQFWPRSGSAPVKEETSGEKKLSPMMEKIRKAKENAAKKKAGK